MGQFSEDCLVVGGVKNGTVERGLFCLDWTLSCHYFGDNCDIYRLQKKFVEKLSLLGKNQGFSALNHTINQGFSALNHTINQGFSALSHTINQGFSALNRTINQGFSALNRTINQGFSALNRTINQGFSALNRTKTRDSLHWTVQ